MKQSKGVTLVSLVVIVVILVILASIVITTTTPALKKANIVDIKTELMLIQAKWKIEREKVNFNGESSLDSSIVNSEDGDNKGKLKDEYEYNENAEWKQDGDTIQYYKLPNKALESMGVEVKSNNGYIVNYEDDEIIYLPGVELEERTIVYKLSDM